MKFGISLAVSAGIALLLATGCSQTQQSIVRGQSPVVQPSGVYDGPIIGTAPGYGERPHVKSHTHDFKILHQNGKPLADHHGPDYGYDDGAYDGREQFYPNHHKHVYDVGGAEVGCPACNGGLSCPPSGCPHCGYGCGHHCPKHVHSYQYNWPQNLVYPSPVLPAGMVQYPYYTLRGPTDFFMK